MAYQFYVPTRTMFGCGVLNDLHTQKMPGKKAMVVISNEQSMKRTGTLQCLLEQLEQADVEAVVFDRENGCDFIVALGGGSVMDAANRKKRTDRRDRGRAICLVR